jgi:hypothetical protein
MTQARETSSALDGRFADVRPVLVFAECTALASIGIVVKMHSLLALRQALVPYLQLMAMVYRAH